MKSPLTFGLTAAVLMSLGAFSAVAQTAPPQPHSLDQSAQPPQPGASAPRVGLTPAEHAAHRKQISASRLDELKKALNLTPAQEHLWPALAVALDEGANETAAAAENNAKLHDASKPATIIDRLQAMADQSEANAQLIRKVLAAANPLYTSLSEDQKKIADELGNGNPANGYRVQGDPAGAPVPPLGGQPPMGQPPR